jgi:hypothetical protein
MITFGKQFPGYLRKRPDRFMLGCRKTCELNTVIVSRGRAGVVKIE